MKKGEVQNFNYTGKKEAITLSKGVYRLECWGAQGGSYSSYYGGYGGYSCGNLTLTEDTIIYVCVGGQPASSSTSSGAIAGGFNGGGNGCGRYYSGTYTYGQGGGGGTDIRIGTDSLYARVIVAGGGGGSASTNANTTKYGGGASGGSPQSGYAASQTGAGSGGSFGQGGAATTNGTNYKYGSGGGGGGWYGGGACTQYSDSTNYRGYNGGGSGYVYTSSTASSYPPGCLLNSSYYLLDAMTIAGNQSITSPAGTTTTGNSGNGYARITMIKGGNIPVWVKDNNQWKQGTTLYTKSNGNWQAVADDHINNYINTNLNIKNKYVWKKMLKDENIKLLLHGDSFTDSSIYSVPIVNTGVTINSTQQHFNNDSLYFNGNAYLTINDTTLCNGTNDWTIDWWEYRTSDVTNAGTITRNGPSGSYNGLLLGYTIKSSNLLQFYAANSATSADWNMISECTMGSIILNQWVHRCVVRHGSNFYCFENGILKGTATSSESFNATAPIQIGYYAGENYYGYLSEICFRDNAKWISDFTPPIEPYTGFQIVEYKINKNINAYPEEGYADDGYYYKRL